MTPQGLFTGSIALGAQPASTIPSAAAPVTLINSRLPFCGLPVISPICFLNITDGLLPRAFTELVDCPAQRADNSET